MVQDLTKTELEIMKIFWRSDVPLTRKQVQQLNSVVRKNSVNPMIRRLIEKEWIHDVGRVFYSRSSSAAYEPKVTIDEYLLTLIDMQDVPTLMLALSARLGDEDEINVIIDALVHQKEKVIDADQDEADVFVEDAHADTDSEE